MAILDDYLVFYDNVALTADGISDVVDQGATAPATTAFGPGWAGTDLFLVLQVGTAFAGGTSIAFDLVSDSVAALSASPTLHMSTGAIPVANLTANTVVAVLPIPPGDFERYIGLRHDVTGTFTAGTIRGYLTQTPPAWRALTANNPLAT